MAAPTHLNLDLLFERSAAGYVARVVRSPAGDGQSAEFARPISDMEVENFALKIGLRRERSRRLESEPVSAAKKLGGRLFSSVFAGPVAECLRRSVDTASDQDVPLRIRLRLSDCPELADLPWELLYDAGENWFLALSGGTPVVRYVQLATQPRQVKVELPLRVLVIKSEPDGYEPLDLKAEWDQVTRALADLIDSGAIAITELAVPTLGELRRALLRDKFNVLHYLGHGAFTERQGGTLLFTDQAGRGVPVTGESLGVILRDHSSLRLAVLNACEAARTDPADPFAGVAETLVRRHIPAVIAMQFEITDNAAIEFASALYGALAAGRPIDTAVAEARKAIYTVSQVEWATPVLYLRADDARLFDIADPTRKSAPAPAQRTEERARELLAEGGRLSAQHRYPEAETAYREAIRLDPSNANPHNNLGNVLRELKRYPEAETAYREAIRLDPSNPAPHNNLGFVLWELKRYPEAETAYREAIRLDPSLAYAHRNLVQLLRQQGKSREVKEARLAAGRAGDSVD